MKNETEQFMSILVETSARHVHLSKQDLEKLFGAGYELTVKKELSQPGQYACEERVTVVGPKKELANVSILGPTRNDTQIEISLTDARSIGINAPVRESGDLAGSPGCTLKGPNGTIEIENGVIVAKRHIHITPKDAQKLNVQDKQIVSVSTKSAGRSAILGDVVVRVNKDYATAMHIDTDESNAIGSPTEGEIVL